MAIRFHLEEIATWNINLKVLVLLILEILITVLTKLYFLPKLYIFIKLHEVLHPMIDTHYNGQPTVKKYVSQNYFLRWYKTHFYYIRPYPVCIKESILMTLPFKLNNSCATSNSISLYLFSYRIMLLVSQNCIEKFVFSIILEPQCS